MTRAAGAAPEPITPEDIEAKFRELQGDVDDVQQEAVNMAVTVGAVAVGVVVVVAFWLGRRRGRRSRTVLEIRRV